RARRAPRGRLLGLLRVTHRRRRPRGPVPRPGRRSLPAPALGLGAGGPGRLPVPRPRGDLPRRRRLLRAAGAHAGPLRRRRDRRVQPDRRARAADPGGAGEPVVMSAVAADPAPRERMLAGLPVTERRLDLAGTATA